MAHWFSTSTCCRNFLRKPCRTFDGSAVSPAPRKASRTSGSIRCVQCGARGSAGKRATRAQHTARLGYTAGAREGEEVSRPPGAPQPTRARRSYRAKGSTQHCGRVSTREPSPHDAEASAAGWWWRGDAAASVARARRAPISSEVCFGGRGSGAPPMASEAWRGCNRVPTEPPPPEPPLVGR